MSSICLIGWGGGDAPAVPVFWLVDGGGVIGGEVVDELNCGEWRSFFTTIALFLRLLDFGGVGESLLLFIFVADPVIDVSSDWDSAAENNEIINASWSIQ